MKQLLKSAAKISLVYSNAYRFEKNKIKKREREKMENSDYWMLGSNSVEKKKKNSSCNKAVQIFSVLEKCIWRI